MTPLEHISEDNAFIPQHAVDGVPAQSPRVQLRFLNETAQFLPGIGPSDGQSWSLKVALRTLGGMQLYLEVAEWLVQDILMQNYPELDIYNDIEAITDVFKTAIGPIVSAVDPILGDKLYVAAVNYQFDEFEANKGILRKRQGVIKRVTSPDLFAVNLYMPFRVAKLYDRWIDSLAPGLNSGQRAKAPRPAATPSVQTVRPDDGSRVVLNMPTPKTGAVIPPQPTQSYAPEMRQEPEIKSAVDVQIIAGVIRLSRSVIEQLTPGDIMALQHSQLETDEYLIWGDDRMLGYAKPDTEGWVLTRTAVQSSDRDFHRAVRDAQSRLDGELRAALDVTVLARTTVFEMPPEALDRLVKGSQLPVDMRGLTEVDLVLQGRNLGHAEIVALEDGLAVRVAPSMSDSLDEESTDAG